MARHAREITTRDQRPKRLLSRLTGSGQDGYSPQRLALWLSALIVVAVVPASASAIHGHLTNPHTPTESPDEMTGKSRQTEPPASTKAKAEAYQESGGSSAPADVRVRVNGQAVQMTENGSHTQTIRTKNGQTDIDIRVRDNLSAGAGDDDSSSQTRIRISTDSEFDSSVQEDFSVEVDE